MGTYQKAVVCRDFGRHDRERELDGRFTASNLFFVADDSARVARTFRNLASHDISRWALTGGIAIEFHILHRGSALIRRQLHDIDFMTGSFASIPETVGSKLLLRHVHPLDPPSKNMLQGIQSPDGWILVAPRSF
jgi:hypothetical protein